MSVIASNIAAVNSLNRFQDNQGSVAKAHERLSSGLKINRAVDDAAGLAISEKMRGQIRGLAQAQRNVQDGISLTQTADSGLEEIQSMVHRQRELAVQAANDALTAEDREKIQEEIDELKHGINDIANNTHFNEINLLNRTSDGETVIRTVEEEVTRTETSVIDFVSCYSNSYIVKSPGNDLYGYNFDYEESQDSNSPLAAEINTSTSRVTITWGANNEPSSLTDINDVITEAVRGANIDTEVIYETTSGNSFSFTTFLSEQGQFAALHDRGITEEYTREITETVTSEIEEIVEGHNVILQVGPNSQNHFKVELTDARTGSLGIDEIEVDPFERAMEAIEKLDEGLKKVSSERGKYGAYQNALQHIHHNLSNSEENLSAAKSRIRDVDMAAEMMEMTRANILSQASQSMLAQANQQPQSVLQLLG
ncbi:flagellin N-terminal helical domain-containing protein [Bacillus sp. FJAT-44742]|uniref:flagellin N-terminal helical domain-containing protein n=1 Tax=Bacillus sp. FJAT-44742 TaxID=2014005 RepID=UPI000C2492AA|nr:flagellin [Bacillus sp. FJAT-44742]